ncbi:uncharacterized protein RAG0_08790 [Rhynchosporium agropyri]|uniref:Uncharacterized protein n=1 Tax=Rhynchosporium agropyri TaxID=914238 RepID=A0A1E1KV98_9HELO|nr:uncharacterized protein RAG0_08790 [Rhynchosporium agropyri]
MKLSILALSQFVLLGSAEVIYAVGVCKPNQHAQCGLDGDHKRRCLGVKKYVDYPDVPSLLMTIALILFILSASIPALPTRRQRVQTSAERVRKDGVPSKYHTQSWLEDPTNTFHSGGDCYCSGLDPSTTT